MRVLIIKTSSMGDVLHTLPSLTDSLMAIPNIIFDWVIEERFAQIPSWHPAVNKVFPIKTRRWHKMLLFASIEAICKIPRKMICMQNYDAIIDAQGLIKSAVITYLANGIKHGMNWKTAREPLASIFYDFRHNITKQQHAVERIRELFAKSLGYVKPVIMGDFAITKYFSYVNTSKITPYAILVHATTHKIKCWPEEYWRKLIKLIQSNGICIKIPWGNESERRCAERLAMNFTQVKVLPKLSLKQIAEEIIGAQFIISIDTGLSHLAAALNRPNITMFGPTDPKLIGGYGKNQYWAVSINKLMKKITVNDIFKILQEKNMFSKRSS